MSEAFDYFADSMNVIAFERTESQADFVWYMCGSAGRWTWRDSLTGKGSAESFISREEAMSNAKAATGRC